MDFVLTRTEGCAAEPLQATSSHHLEYAGYSLILSSTQGAASDIQVHSPGEADRLCPQVLFQGNQNGFYDAGFKVEVPLAGQLAEFFRKKNIDNLKGVAGSYLLLVVWPNPSRIVCYRSLEGGVTCYWTKRGKRVSISSSVAQLALATSNDYHFNNEWLTHFFSLNIDSPPGATPFEAVHELRPGDALECDYKGVRVSPTPLDLRGDAAQRSDRDWVGHFSQHLDDAVAHALPRDGSVGIMLSGGMDSGPIAALSTARLGSERVQAISWRIPSQPDADEWPWIQLLANYLKIQVHEINADHYQPFASLTPNLVDDDSPILNPFRALMLECYRAASERGHRIVLNGTAGDILYPDRKLALSDAMGHTQWRRAWKLLQTELRKHPVGQFHRISSVKYLLRQRFPWLPDRSKAPAWLSSDARTAWGLQESWPPELSNAYHRSYASQLFSPGASGPRARERRYSLRFGVDRRDPYLNVSLRTLMLNAPHSMSHREGTTKWLAREAMSGRLPEKFRLKPRTGLLNSFARKGFDDHRSRIREFVLDRAQSWAPWLRTDWVESILNSSNPTGRERLVITWCIGFLLWQDRLRMLRESQNRN